MTASVAYVWFIQASWTVLYAALVFLLLAMAACLWFAALVLNFARRWWG